MPSHAHPTVSEALALAARVPRNPRPPDIPSMLRRMLTPFSTHWIRDFLLTDDQLHLPHLTSSSLHATSITCDIAITRVEPPLPAPPALPPARNLSGHLVSSIVFTPVFTVDTLTLGFGLQELAVNTGALGQWSSNRRFDAQHDKFRFICDHENGTLTLIYDDPINNRVRVDFMHNTSSMSHTRAFSIFKRHHFLQACSETRLSDVHTALLAFHSCDETRQCPYCGTLNESMCACERRRVRPKHPFDYDAFVHNMVIYAGSFEGSGSMLVFGSPYTRNAPLGTRMALTGGSDGDLVNRLRGWALAEGVRGTESPWESALFAHVSGACEEETFLGDAFFKDHVMDPCGDTFGVGVADHVMGSVLDGALVNVTDPRCFDVYMNTGEMGDADASGSTGPDSCHESWSIAVGSVLERKSIVAPPKESYIGNRDKVVAVEVGERKERRPRTASTPVEEEEGSPNVKVCDVISDNVVDEDGEEEARRRVKAQIRRDRNRAAAARSNQKKKAMNDALKAQLKESRDRAETLRDRETSLRQENLLLRKILGEMGKA